MKRFTLALALAALTVPAIAQQQPVAGQPLTERIEVNAVLLDAIVTDPEGNQILGLGKDDFVVTENGVPQEIDSVDYFTNRHLLDSREEQAPFKVEKVRDERYFIFFFDKPQSLTGFFNELALARHAVQKFIRDDMKRTDRVAIAGHDVRLKVYSDFTNDPKQLNKALDQALLFGKGLTRTSSGAGPSILKALDQEEMMNATGTVYQALDVLADAVRPIAARKNLVLFSPGIIEHNETIREDMIISRSQHLDPALESLNAANVSVYGVQLQRGPEVAGTMLFHQRLDELADSTGGEYFRSNTEYTRAVQRIEKTNAGYYLVTYRSKHPRGKSGFQKVRVSVRNSDLRVVARSGYQYGG